MVRVEGGGPGDMLHLIARTVHLRVHKTSSKEAMRPHSLYRYPDAQVPGRRSVGPRISRGRGRRSQRLIRKLDERH